MMKHRLFFRGTFISNSLPLIIGLVVSTGTLRAQKLTVQKSQMSFTSNAELELIRAASDKVQGLIDPASNQFAFSVDVQSFRGFNSELQREHFNEKYLESEKYPKARFSGKIIEPVDFTTNQSYDVRAKGELDIHGQKQTRIIKTKVTVENGLVYLETRFFVPLADHNISIPSIVSQKIATEIEVDFKATLSPQHL
jgi:polyisoprenoid-binding protein YceI